MSIDALLGIAMGAMGIRLAEFEILTPEQFDEIYKAWRQRQDDLSHERWEVARLIGQCAVSPHSKKKLKPTDIIRFPWELAPKTSGKKLSEKSTKERYEEIKERWK